jgi:hypothetical protein
LDGGVRKRDAEEGEPLERRPAVLVGCAGRAPVFQRGVRCRCLELSDRGSFVVLERSLSIEDGLVEVLRRVERLGFECVSRPAEAIRASGRPRGTGILRRIFRELSGF